ncbi:hypothetical protein [Spirosoma pollinicola]|uniref:hypothetical protein n=1 Tax=Spirosoma pollinicola TaxID=2057025 RepID=UPI00198170ED|nr:hypothetical protein [Spirosoma pollinicola]
MNTYLNDLLGYKKKKTRHLFRWKVVEAYRAERVQASELEETLGIPMRELRRLNRNYFRLRLLPLLQPKNRRKTMKRDADYVKTLERKLLAS